MVNFLKVKVVWAKFCISYFTPLVRQLATCHVILWWGFTVTAHHVGSTWRPIPKAHLGSHIESPYGLDTILSMAHLKEGFLVKLAHLWAIHSMSQPNPWVSPFYSTLSPTCPSYPMSRVTLYGMGHILQVESTHELGLPIKWVTLWVRLVSIKTLDLLDLTI